MLPPGPRRLPILGNLIDISRDMIHVKARDWSRMFGTEVISLRVLGNVIIVLNSARAVSDVFDKRGSNYSDRPDLPMLVDLMGWDWTFALMRYGPRWKEHRRVFHTHLNHNAKEHQQLQGSIVLELLRLLWHYPGNYPDHLQHYTGHIILKRIYGHAVKDYYDPYIQLVKEASASASEAAVPGAFFVDLFPSLKYIPEWIPGAGFKRKARLWRKLSTAMVNVPYDTTKANFLKGEANSCFVATCLEANAMRCLAGEDVLLTEELIKNTAAVAYAAGADTTAATLKTFLLAMCLYPEIQQRAQAELDTLLCLDGHLERLPTFSDRKNLPYLNAIVKEVLRWIPVLPFAVPHRSMEDDTYSGFLIPKDSTVIGNAWAILHDEAMFPSPDVFSPERFLDGTDILDPADIGAFGFGRRSCAGKEMALDTIWIAIASILAIFNVSRVKDKLGNEVVPEIKVNFGAIR
ncbi:cytochrome P450 [Vararia minispora EC-137]|uniref:Cytochrome P450 n=1 Tax=Vararia minispora EC-137 TaxID=1314806 RepID=A0ACB8QKJ3_9AGAM|nr:cytochrome P450 [Vararia minispora EC-137]